MMPHRHSLDVNLLSVVSDVHPIPPTPDSTWMTPSISHSFK